jgi:hypothetical protein
MRDGANDSDAECAGVVIGRSGGRERDGAVALALVAPGFRVLASRAATVPAPTTGDARHEVALVDLQQVLDVLRDLDRLETVGAGGGGTGFFAERADSATPTPEPRLPSRSSSS